MYPTFTVEENLRLPCEVLGLPEAEIKRRLERVLDVVPQLEPMLARSGAALSGGQGKMAALGRALMAGTKLVLLDEPFQGLAPVLANQYAESLRKLHQLDPALCIVVTESNRSLLRDLPDATLTLERGELVEGVVAVAGERVDVAGLQQAELVVVAQHAHRHLAEPREVADLVHPNPPDAPKR